MDAKEAEDLIRQLLAEFFELEEDGIDVHANLAEAYDIDSLQLLDLMMAVQDRAGVIIPDDEVLAQVTTASQAAALLRQLTESGAIGQS